jgi:hypothetical protein
VYPPIIILRYTRVIGGVYIPSPAPMAIPL